MAHVDATKDPIPRTGTIVPRFTNSCIARAAVILLTLNTT
jgi:hypothetical protein